MHGMQAGRQAGRKECKQTERQESECFTPTPTHTPVFPPVFAAFISERSQLMSTCVCVCVCVCECASGSLFRSGVATDRHTAPPAHTDTHRLNSIAWCVVFRCMEALTDSLTDSFA